MLLAVMGQARKQRMAQGVSHSFLSRRSLRLLLLGTCLTPLLPVAALALPACGPFGDAVQTCSGAIAAPVTISEYGLQPVTVTTNPGFSVDISSGDGAALSLNSGGSLSFTDVNGSRFSNSASPAATAISIYAQGTADVSMQFSSNGTINGRIASFLNSFGGDASLDINLDQQAGSHFIMAEAYAATGAARTEINASGDIVAPDGVWASGIDVKSIAGTGSTVTINANNVQTGNSGAAGINIQTRGFGEGDTSNVTTLNIAGTLRSAQGFGLSLDSLAIARGGNARSDINIQINAIESSSEAIFIASDAQSYLAGSIYADAPNSELRLTTTGTVQSKNAAAISAYSYGSDQFITIAGAVNGGNGVAIQLWRNGYRGEANKPLREQNGIASQTVLELHPGMALNGTTNLLAEGIVVDLANQTTSYDYYYAPSNGHLVLGGSGTATFDLTRIDNRANAAIDGAADRISGFGTLSTSGDAEWSLTGNNDRDANDAFLYAEVKTGQLTLDNARLALRATTPDLVWVAQNRFEMPSRMMVEDAVPAAAPDLTNVAAIPDGAVAGALTIGAAGTLAVNGASSVMGNVINAGTILINPCADCAGNTLTVAGDYVGNGGVVSIGTVLGDDASLTDKLVIEGNASGSSTVKVVNEKGKGALTREGIEIITIGGDSNAIFTLDGDYVVAGAYTYRLHKGNASGSDAKDWYLRSALSPVDPTEPTDPSTPVEPQPEYHVGSPVYEAYAQSLLGMNGVATLQQRVGNRVWAGNGNKVIAQGADAVQPEASAAEAGQAVEGNGVWGRIEGSHSHIEPKFSTTDTNYNQNVFKLQAGIDGKLSESETGALIGGVFVHYVHGKTKTSSTNYADGEIASDGYGFGGTLTWYGDKGFYVDAQAQATWYSSDLTTSALAAPVLKDGNDGFGYALSLEAGQRFAVNEAWSLTPQAQLIYSRVDFDTFTDGFGSSVGLDKGDSLQGRLGLTLDHASAWQNANGGMDRANIYGIVNLYNEFLGGTRVDLADQVSLASKKDRTWGGIGAGGSYNWDNDKYSIYGEGLINTSLNNFGDSYSVKGNAGFRVSW